MAYNLKRVMNIRGIGPLIAAMSAYAAIMAAISGRMPMMLMTRLRL